MTWTGLSAPTGPRWPGGRAYLREIRRSAELLRERSLVPAARTMDGSPPPPLGWGRGGAGPARHRSSAAPPPGHPQMDLPAPDGTAAGQRRDRRADRAARHREPRPGAQEEPIRASQAAL